MGVCVYVAGDDSRHTVSVLGLVLDCRVSGERHMAGELCYASY